jgi:membrane-associated phospholipid phosphatase
MADRVTPCGSAKLDQMVSLSRPARWGLVALGAACLTIVVAVGFRLHDVRGPVRLDVRTARPVFDRIYGVPVVPVRIARWFQRLGNPPQFAIIVGLLALAGAAMRDRLVIWVSMAAPVVAEILSEAVGKPLVGRTNRLGGDAFPSGHTTAMTAIAAVLVLVVYRRWGTRALLWGVPVAALLSMSMVMSVVRLHSHVMSDALGGVLVGVGTVALITAGVDALVSRVHMPDRRVSAAPR